MPTPAHPQFDASGHSARVGSGSPTVTPSLCVALAIGEGLWVAVAQAVTSRVVSAALRRRPGFIYGIGLCRSTLLNVTRGLPLSLDDGDTGRLVDLDEEVRLKCAPG